MFSSIFTTMDYLVLVDCMKSHKKDTEFCSFLIRELVFVPIIMHVQPGLGGAGGGPGAGCGGGLLWWGWSAIRACSCHQAVRAQ